MTNNSASNDGVGVHCPSGGRVAGDLYHLAGKMFPKLIEEGCVESLSLEEK